MNRRPILDGIVGAIVFVALTILGLAVSARFVPQTAALDGIVRVADNLAFHLLGGVAIIGCFLWLVRVRWVGAVLILVSLGCGVWMYSDFRKHTLPLVQAQDGAGLDLVFFNVLALGFDRAPMVADALIATNADVIILSEANLLSTEIDRLQDHFAVTSGCEEGEVCEILILSRTSAIQVNRSLRLSNEIAGRYAQIGVTVDGQPLTIVATHLFKPWFSGFSWNEHARLRRFIGRIDGPVVVTGDFNAAPWSYQVNRLLEVRDLYAVRWPLASWPAWAGRFGVPIDQMLVGQGARLASIAPYGDGLGSNHRGIRATVVIEN